MRKAKKMKCPVCGSLNHRVIDTAGGCSGTYRRIRKCTSCNVPFSTIELTEERYQQLVEAERKLNDIIDAAGVLR